MPGRDKTFVEILERKESSNTVSNNDFWPKKDDEIKISLKISDVCMMEIRLTGENKHLSEFRFGENQ